MKYKFSSSLQFLTSFVTPALKFCVQNICLKTMIMLSLFDPIGFSFSIFFPACIISVSRKFQAFSDIYLKDLMDCNEQMFQQGTEYHTFSLHQRV